MCFFSCGCSVPDSAFSSKSSPPVVLARGGGAGCFLVVEMTPTSPLFRLPGFRETRLSSSLTLTLLVTTVMMTTLVVGPFYLSRGLGLGSTVVGLALSVGPLLAACGGLGGKGPQAGFTAPPPPGRANVPAIMVACRQCGTHLPETEAVRGQQGTYCSTEHRAAAQDRNPV